MIDYMLFRRQSPRRSKRAEIAQAKVAKELKTDITIENVRERRPDFKRRYCSVLDSRAFITVEIYWLAGTRYESGELRQPNGRRIHFDPRSVADKIIDPVLVPLVQQCVDEIRQMDRDFIRSNPSEFTDELGTRWVMKGKAS